MNGITCTVMGQNANAYDGILYTGHPVGFHFTVDLNAPVGLYAARQ